MKPTVILTNKEVYHNLSLLKHFNTVKIKNTKKNSNTLNKVLKNINRSTKFVSMIKNKNEIILTKRNSKLDFRMYLR